MITHWVRIVRQPPRNVFPTILRGTNSRIIADRLAVLLKREMHTGGVFSSGAIRRLHGEIERFRPYPLLFAELRLLLLWHSFFGAKKSAE